MKAKKTKGLTVDQDKLYALTKKLLDGGDGLILAPLEQTRYRERVKWGHAMKEYVLSFDMQREGGRSFPCALTLYPYGTGAEALVENRGAVLEEGWERKILVEIEEETLQTLGIVPS